MLHLLAIKRVLVKSCMEIVSVHEFGRRAYCLQALHTLINLQLLIIIFIQHQMAPVSSFVSAITIVVANLIALVHIHGVDVDEIGQCKVEPIPNVCSFLWNNGPLFGDENGIEKLYDVVDWSPEDGQGFNDGILTPDGRDKRCYANLPPLRNQPNCNKTCNLNSDDRYLEISGLENIEGQQNNTISLKDVIGNNQTKIDDINIVCTFGEFEP